MNALSPLASLYACAARFRGALYDRGALRSFDLGARTISIGNLTAGGTGKTPVVRLTAEMLAANGETVCVLTRGYGRRDPGMRVLVSDGKNVLADASSGGDEPVELARKLIGKAAVIADADRVAAAAWASEHLGSTAFVLDDAFQHRRVKRDVDIVCIDATNPWGGGKMLPAGRLREPLSSLARADAVVITRSDLVDGTGEIRETIAKHAAGAKIFESANRVCGIRPLGTDGQASSDWPALRAAIAPGGDARFFLFCGLGNPDSFFRMIDAEFARDAGLAIAGREAFRDHHIYTQQDADTLTAKAREHGADGFLTTAKDAVKLGDLRFGLPVFVVEIDAALDDTEGFRRLVTSS